MCGYISIYNSLITWSRRLEIRNNGVGTNDGIANGCQCWIARNLRRNNITAAQEQILRAVHARFCINTRIFGISADTRDALEQF
jgi:hypothetical protein